MQVRILGPFQLEEGGRRITIGGLRQRAVLADLVLRANEVVPSEQLLVDLWGEDSPPSWRKAVGASRLADSGSAPCLPIWCCARTRSCRASSSWWTCGARTPRPARGMLFRRRSHDCDGYFRQVASSPKRLGMRCGSSLKSWTSASLSNWSRRVAKFWHRGPRHRLPGY